MKGLGKLKRYTALDIGFEVARPDEVNLDGLIWRSDVKKIRNCHDYKPAVHAVHGKLQQSTK